MNNLLRKTSDDLIDLLEQMLCKNMSQRIDMLGIYDHPWIIKYKRKDEVDSEEKASITSSSDSDEPNELEDYENADVIKSDSSSADGEKSH